MGARGKISPTKIWELFVIVSTHKIWEIAYCSTHKICHWVSSHALKVLTHPLNYLYFITKFILFISGEEHDDSFDHEAILGSKKDAEDFDQLPPEEAKKRLAILVEKMDSNK